MLSKFARVAGIALVLACVSAPASAQNANRLGWLNELAGSCYQGSNAAGAVVDRQCFREQFGRFLRASITRGATYRGESVLGYSSDRTRLEVYAWDNQGHHAILTPTLANDELAFAGASGDTRAIWRRSDGAFSVIEQRREGSAWVDTGTTTYRRDGAASSAFSAGLAVGANGSGFEWLDRIAGRCYVQSEPNNANNRGCFAFQYSNVLRQTWYTGSQVTATGEAALIRSADGGINFFYWDARGGFGVGESAFSGRHLVSVTDAGARQRSVLSSSRRGFTIETQRQQGSRWEYADHFRYQEQ
jgi:hypothetical protein